MSGNRLPEVSVGILAGGKSSRMGENKALMKIGNERMIGSLIKELSVFTDIIISAARPGDYEEFGLKTVYDENIEIGPMEGIRRILSEAENEYVFICAADMPRITADFVRALKHFLDSGHDCYIVCDEDHLQPLCSIYKKTVIPVIDKLIADGVYKLRKIFDLVNTKYIPLEILNFDKKTVKNINTREDLIEYNKPFVFCVSGPSDSGKTGLIVKLINEFIESGMSVSVLKHDGCDRLSDKPGSDTEKYFNCGAVTAAAFSNGGSIIHTRNKRDDTEMLKLLKAESPDVILIEGLKNSSYPKVEIVRRGIGEGVISPPESLICITTDFITPDSVNCSVYGLDDVKGVFLCICRYFGLKF